MKDTLLTKLSGQVLMSWSSFYVCNEVGNGCYRLFFVVRTRQIKLRKEVMSCKSKVKLLEGPLSLV